MLQARDQELEEEAAEIRPYQPWAHDGTLSSGAGGGESDGGSSDRLMDRKELYRSLKAMRAVMRIQDSWRIKALGHDQAKISMALNLDEDAADPPELALAKEAAEEMLPRRESDGERYTWNEGLASFDAFGVEVACYMRFVVYMGRACWLALLLNLSNIVSNIEGGNVDNLLGKHSLNNAECLGNAYGVVEVLTSLIFVIFTFWIRGHVKNRAEMIRQDTLACKHLTAANFSVIATNCPDDLSCEEKVRLLRETLGRKFGEVVHVGVALDNRQLIQAMEQRSRLMSRKQDAGAELLRAIAAERARQQSSNGAVLQDGSGSGGCASTPNGRGAAGDGWANSRAPRRVARAGRALDRAVQALRDFEKDGKVNGLLRENPATKRPYKCTGTAFVTFNSSAVASRCAEAGSVLFEKSWLRLAPAPAPDQILWENLQFNNRERYMRQVGSTALLFLLTLIGAATIAWTTFLKPDVEWIMHCATQEANIEEQMRCALGIWDSLGVLLGSTVFIILGHVIIFVAAPVFAFLFERPHFFYEREYSIFVKLTFFQVFNVLVSMYLMLHRGDEGQTFNLNFNSEITFGGWLEHAVPLIVNVLVGDAIVINLGIDLCRPDILVRRRCIAPRQRTQSKMNRAYVIDADIWLAFRMQLMSKVVLLTLMFSSAMPALLLIVGLYCWSAHLVDKQLLFKVLRKPPHTMTLRLMHILVCWLMPLAVLFRLAFSIFVFYYLQCGCSGLPDGQGALAATSSAAVASAVGSPQDVLLGRVSTWRPVQFIVITSNCVLALPMLLFVFQESRKLGASGRCCSSSPDVTDGPPSPVSATALAKAVTAANLQAREQQANPTRALAESTAESTAESMASTAGGRSRVSQAFSQASAGPAGFVASRARQVSNLVEMALHPTQEVTPPQKQTYTRVSGAFIRTEAVDVQPSRSARSARKSSGAREQETGERNGSLPTRTVSFGASVKEDEDNGLSARHDSLGARSRGESTAGGRSRAGTATSRGTAFSTGSTAMSANARAMSFSKHGFGRSRVTSSSTTGKYVLPDVAQMYLPPLTMHIMRKLVVYDPVHVQRAKREARQRALIASSSSAQLQPLAEPPAAQDSDGSPNLALTPAETSEHGLSDRPRTSRTPSELGRLASGHI